MGKHCKEEKLNLNTAYKDFLKYIRQERKTIIQLIIRPKKVHRKFKIYSQAVGYSSWVSKNLTVS